MSRKDLANDVMHAADIMRRDDGTNGINEYIEQISWMIFLKVFEDLENRFEAEHSLQGRKYDRIIPKKYSWSEWTRKGTKEIIGFIDTELFPSLSSLSGTPERNIIAQIFSEIQRNKMKSASNLKDVLDIVDKIDFNNPDDSHILSQFYEDMLVKLGKESGLAGEFYTPRPVVKLMVKMIDPKISSKKEGSVRILDPFCGSCGFLIESYKHITENEKITAKNYLDLQRKIIHGYEKKSLPFLVGLMNCILHGLLTPNILRKNSLNENILNFGVDDKFDYVLTNPPFGGTENKQIQQNFPIKVQATQLLAVQHVMRRLKPGGKCGIVVPESLLSATDNAYIAVKKELLENFNLNTVISLPQGVFANVTSAGPGPKTCILLFNKMGKTEKIWYYKLKDPKPSYSKSNSISDEDLVDCYSKWIEKKSSENSWLIPVERIIENDYNLMPKELLSGILAVNRSPVDLVQELETNEKEMKTYVNKIKQLIEATLVDNEFKIEKMSKFLKPRREFIKVDDEKEYQRITVQLHSKGIIPRDKVLGKSLKTKKQQLTKAYDLIVAEIDAKMGGFGIVPPELEDAIVSNHYFLYEIDDTQVIPQFLAFFLKTGKPTMDIQEFVKGSHNYASIKPEHFLQLDMPVPVKLKKQSQFVELQEKVLELEETQKSIKSALGMILSSTYQLLFENKKWQTLQSTS